MSETAQLARLADSIILGPSALRLRRTFINYMGEIPPYVLSDGAVQAALDASVPTKLGLSATGRGELGSSVLGVISGLQNVIFFTEDISAFAPLNLDLRTGELRQVIGFPLLFMTFLVPSKSTGFYAELLNGMSGSLSMKVMKLLVLTANLMFPDEGGKINVVSYADNRSTDYISFMLETARQNTNYAFGSASSLPAVGLGRTDVVNDVDVSGFKQEALQALVTMMSTLSPVPLVQKDTLSSLLEDIRFTDVLDDRTMFTDFAYPKSVSGASGSSTGPLLLSSLFLGYVLSA